MFPGFLKKTPVTRGFVKLQGVFPSGEKTTVHIINTLYLNRSTFLCEKCCNNLININNVLLIYLKYIKNIIIIKMYMHK